jgi:hypothetical protein
VNQKLSLKKHPRDPPNDRNPGNANRVAATCGRVRIALGKSDLARNSLANKRPRTRPKSRLIKRPRPTSRTLTGIRSRTGNGVKSTNPLTNVATIEDLAVAAEEVEAAVVDGEAGANEAPADANRVDAAPSDPVVVGIVPRLPHKSAAKKAPRKNDPGMKEPGKKDPPRKLAAKNDRRIARTVIDPRVDHDPEAVAPRVANDPEARAAKVAANGPEQKVLEARDVPPSAGYSDHLDRNLHGRLRPCRMRSTILEPD